MISAPSAGLRVIHVIAGLYEAHGGPSYSVPRLCHALADAGVSTKLMSVAAPNSEPSSRDRAGYQDIRFAQDGADIPLLRGLRLSSGLAAALKDAASEASIIHNHGLWLAPNLVSGHVAKRAHKPLIVSPRGMLSPGALHFSRAKKALIWRLGQGRVIHNASCLHATSELEYQELRALGLKNPIAIIANGIDLVDARAKDEARERTLLYLGRMHPKKGLDQLLRAWAKIEPAFPDWRLRLVGPAEEGHDAVLERLIAELGIRRVVIEGAIYGGAKQAAYQDAELFVLPSISENFGLTCAEALASGVPVIATKGTPWSGLAHNKCGWWIDHGVEPLAAALRTAMAVPSRALQEMGARGRSWMAREFSWERVGLEMAALYFWLGANGEIPPTIRFA